MSGYRLHEVLVAPARPSASLGRLAAGFVVLVVGVVIANLVYFESLRTLFDWETLLPEILEGSTPRAMWLMLLNFAPLILVLAVVLRLIHKRSLLSVAGPAIMVRLDFRRVLRPTILLFTVLLLLPGPDGLSPVRNMEFGRWLVLMPVSLLLVMIQISAEELLFRGYLQSQLAARFNSPTVWLVLPSLLFAALHYDPGTFGENALPLAIWSGLFGLAAADLTARAGNLGPALALHFVNNVSAMTFTSMQGHWDGLALYVLPFGPDDTEILSGLLLVEALVILCSWLVARIAIRR